MHKHVSLQLSIVQKFFTTLFIGTLELKDLRAFWCYKLITMDCHMFLEWCPIIEYFAAQFEWACENFGLNRFRWLWRHITPRIQFFGSFPQQSASISRTEEVGFNYKNCEFSNSLGELILKKGGIRLWIDLRFRVLPPWIMFVMDPFFRYASSWFEGMWGYAADERSQSRLVTGPLLIPRLLVTVPPFPTK